MVILGHSYLLVMISRAAAAHSSPRRKLGCELSLGWLEKRAETAHTERTKTGGNAPALGIQNFSHSFDRHWGRKVSKKTYLNFLI